MSGKIWFSAGLFILSVYAIWFSFWTVAIALTVFEIFNGQVGPINLREFVASTPVSFMQSFYLLNALIFLSLIAALRRAVIAPTLFSICLIWDAVNWVLFSVLARYDNVLGLGAIGVGVLGAWCLFQWRLVIRPLNAS
ncbi:MAG: hypothetical protein GYB36_05490 [Alphaproteobacteria bacterium]|nr:hypothetical protein [Alphaproteobacteria bacterium]